MTLEFIDQRMDELLAYLPLFGTPSRHLDPVWRGGINVPPDARGAFQWPYPIYLPVIEEFFALASQCFWIDRRYGPEESGELISQDAYIAAASLAQFRKLLTYCVRGERFIDGHWATMIKQGRVGALLRPLHQLRDAPDEDEAGAPG